MGHTFCLDCHAHYLDGHARICDIHMQYLGHLDCKSDRFVNHNAHYKDYLQVKIFFMTDCQATYLKCYTFFFPKMCKCHVLTFHLRTLSFFQSLLHVVFPQLLLPEL